MTLLLDKLRYLVAIYISVDGEWKIVDGKYGAHKKIFIVFLSLSYLHTKSFGPQQNITLITY